VPELYEYRVRLLEGGDGKLLLNADNIKCNLQNMIRPQVDIWPLPWVDNLTDHQSSSKP